MAVFVRGTSHVRDMPTPDPSGFRSVEPIYAALDLGTSNCRMMMAVPARSGFRIIDSFSRVVRLGEDLPTTGRLGEAAMERTLASLDICAQRLARRGVRHVGAVATEACRQAANGAEFLERARRQTGIAIRTISPREEAGLIVESCENLLRGPGRRALVFDIGGGSTEIAWVRLDGGPDGRVGTAPELVAFGSFPFGVVTLPGQLGLDPFTPDGFERAVAHVAEALSGFEAIHRISREIAAGGVTMVGTSGTVTTLAGETFGLARYDRRAIDGAVLTLPQGRQAVRALRALGRTGLALHPCVGEDRVELTLAGCAIFEAIVRLWRAPSVVVADRGLREGMLTRMMRRPSGTPSGVSRGRSVRPAVASAGTGPAVAAALLAGDRLGTAAGDHAAAP